MADRGCFHKQEVVGEGSEVMEMSEGVFAEALADYPGMELHWLQMLYEEQLRKAGSNSMPLMPAVLLPALSGFRAKVLFLHSPTIVYSHLSLHPD